MDTRISEIVELLDMCGYDLQMQPGDTPLFNVDANILFAGLSYLLEENPEDQVDARFSGSRLELFWGSSYLPEARIAELNGLYQKALQKFVDECDAPAAVMAARLLGDLKATVRVENVPLSPEERKRCYHVKITVELPPCPQ